MRESFPLSRSFWFSHKGACVLGVVVFAPLFSSRFSDLFPSGAQIVAVVIVCFPSPLFLSSLFVSLLPPFLAVCRVFACMCVAPFRFRFFSSHPLVIPTLFPPVPTLSDLVSMVTPPFHLLPTYPTTSSQRCHHCTYSQSSQIWLHCHLVAAWTFATPHSLSLILLTMGWWFPPPPRPGRFVLCVSMYVVR
ncbi:hypothetical protein BCR44DRAFT_1061305 [Catenaria anguillulae PL171]|uniref:Transmembrane protein n=1 Tax=Catenaria anguillulae PL171 TaxID=765915 RepID=A0A1Y2HQL9_9FUNG|nr:hypothetical protein BCR44DRAFT_1061305 [Catenaria anguillulae PL171]